MSTHPWPGVLSPQAVSTCKGCGASDFDDHKCTYCHRPLFALTMRYEADPTNLQSLWSVNIISEGFSGG